MARGVRALGKIKKGQRRHLDAERDSEGRKIENLLDGVFTVPNPNLPSQIYLIRSCSNNNKSGKLIWSGRSSQVFFCLVSISVNHVPVIRGELFF